MQQSSRIGGSHETSFTPMISTAKPGWNYLSHNQWGNLVPPCTWQAWLDRIIYICPTQLAE